jgi:predicted ATPase with chaperone activity
MTPHKLIVAPPGAGKTLYARQLAETPPFPLRESNSDRGYIYRVAGLDCKWTQPSFRAPHLREPLRSGVITLGPLTVPAHFRLICGMNPCPCGYTGSERRECKCTPEQIKCYLARVPQWLRDVCAPVSAAELAEGIAT